MIAGTDLVGMVAERLCRSAVEAIGLRYFQPPYQLTPADICCAWHRRHDTDPTHRWLRQTILSAATEVA